MGQAGIGAHNRRTGLCVRVCVRRHEGPVWMVAWAHPSFGSMLASCSHDHKVIIWKETAAGWEKFKEYGMTSDEHASSGTYSESQALPHCVHEQMQARIPFPQIVHAGLADLALRLRRIPRTA
jgi:WD40 repeat protein